MVLPGNGPGKNEQGPEMHASHEARDYTRQDRDTGGKELRRLGDCLPVEIPGVFELLLSMQEML